MSNTSPAAARQPRYLLLNTQYRHPSNATLLAVADALKAAAPGPVALNADLKVGVSTLLSPLHDGIAADVAELTSLLDAAVSTQVPIFLGLDAEEWWSNAQLHNWWDPNATGYHPHNRFNVEWTAADGDAHSDAQKPDSSPCAKR